MWSRWSVRPLLLSSLTKKKEMHSVWPHTGRKHPEVWISFWIEGLADEAAMLSITPPTLTDTFRLLMIEWKVHAKHSWCCGCTILFISDPLPTDHSTSHSILIIRRYVISHVRRRRLSRLVQVKWTERDGVPRVEMLLLLLMATALVWIDASVPAQPISLSNLDFRLGKALIRSSCVALFTSSISIARCIIEAIS